MSEAQNQILKGKTGITTIDLYNAIEIARWADEHQEENAEYYGEVKEFVSELAAKLQAAEARVKELEARVLAFQPLWRGVAHQMSEGSPQAWDSVEKAWLGLEPYRDPTNPFVLETERHNLGWAPLQSASEEKPPQA